MAEMETAQKDKVKSFWEDRAKMGFSAGTNDVVVKQMEMERILSFVKDGMSVLDFGCGNGVSALELASKHRLDILGLDYSENMITEAKKLSREKTLLGNVRFEVGDVEAIKNLDKKFDIIYTERCLINLSTWEEQLEAINCIFGLLKPNGFYLMCENSSDGLDSINSMRASLGLHEIKAPWHNRYFLDAEVESVTVEGMKLIKTEYFSSTYYFLSRVINAWVAKNEGREPKYEDPINMLSLSLPPIGNFGQSRLWVWQKNPHAE